MLGSLKRLAALTAVSMLGLSGLSYAGTGAPNPVGEVIELVVPRAEPEVAPAELPDPPPPAPEAAVASTGADPDDRGVVRSTEGCPEGFTGNHGQFVRGAEDKKAAAHSRCGMPIQSVERRGSGEATPGAKPAGDRAKGNGHGKGHDKAKGEGHQKQRPDGSGGGHAKHGDGAAGNGDG